MTINGKPYSTPRNVNLKDGLLLFSKTYSADPFGDDTDGLYVNDSNQLVFVHQGTSTVIGSGGGGTTPTWEDLYTADKTFAIAGATWTLAGANATADVLTVTNASGSGDCIQITNSGTGYDIEGTSGTWFVTKAGAATFVGVTPGGDITSTATAIDWDIIDDNDSALSFDAGGKAGILALVSTNGAEGVTTSGYFTAAGVITGNGASNTVSNLLLTNNTATTFGADADSSGVAVIRSTSLTTGSLLQLQLTEATLDGGFYLTCRSAAVANVLTIGENGRIAIVGAGGSNMIAITAGDVALSDGSVTLTDADNAATFSATNNTATTASVFVFAGSGVFTGSTTTSFMTITPSGLTTGTAVYLPVAALTTGKALHIVGNALTTGNLVSVTSSATAIATTGRLVSIVHSGATGTSAVLSEFSTAATDETTLLRLTASAALAAGVVLDISAAAMTTGTALDIGGMAALTTGNGIVVAASGTTQTTGILLSLTSAGTAITGAGRLLYSNHTGATGTSAILNEFASAATDETTILKVTASAALAAGKAVYISAAAMTTGTALYIAATEATLTTGKYIECYDGAANDFSVGKYGATVIAGNATGTDALTLTAGDITLTNGDITLTDGDIILTANSSIISFTGTGANGGVLTNLKNSATSDLSGTALDVEINIGGTPYYFHVYPTKA